MKKKLLILLLLATAFILVRCNDASEKKEEPIPGVITPAKFPDPGIPGFVFPEDSNKINGWINAMDENSMAQHGWGIWTALNMSSGQKYDGQDLRVFETWLTPQDMITLITEADNSLVTVNNVKRNRGTLHKPHQFEHNRKALRAAGILGDSIDDQRVQGFVKYDPTAADFAVKNRLFDTEALQTMLNNGATDIPEFPNTGITLKPNFETLIADSLNKYGGYYRLNVWSGDPATPQGYGEGSWPGWVYVDPNNQGQGDGSVDLTGNTRTPQNTYNLSDFVSYTLDEQSAADLKANFGLNAQAGDAIILVAMHVTTKEIKRWTWQSFWWAPNADNPPVPSSAAIAALRPQQLQGAPRHYAMTQAYTFIYPNQPYTGGTSTGTSIYAFNPYLEAGFTPATFTEPSVVVTNGKPVNNNYGIFTNCMSCHAYANYPPPAGAPDYAGDSYVDMNSPVFKGLLKVDFAWSVAFNATTIPKKEKKK